MIGKLKVMLRERKERAAERKAARAADMPHGAAPLAWCVLLTMVGVAALAGSTWMLLVFIAGSVGHFDWFSSYLAANEGPGHFQWSFSMDVHWAVAIGLFLFCAAIAVFNATWLEARRHIPAGGFRMFMTGLGIAVALFMISGATVVQQRGTDARAQDDVVAIQTAQVGQATIAAQIAATEARLAGMRDRTINNEYAAMAALAGEAAYRAEYMNPSRLAQEEPARRRIIERAVGSAVAADALEAQLTTLRSQHAAAGVQTAQAQAVTVRAEGFMGPTTTALEDARKPVTSILGELLALTAFGFALAAWRTRRTDKSVEGSGWAPEDHRIEDHSMEAPLPVDPAGLRPTQKKQRVYNAETGKEEVFVQPRGYWRSTGKKQKNADGTEGEITEFMPDVQPDETGVTADGGNRMASSPAGPIDVEGLTGHPSAERKQQQDEQPVASEHGEYGQEVAQEAAPVIIEHTEPSDEEAAAALMLLQTQADDANPQQDEPQSEEPDQQSEHEETREPETREDRMLPSSVAAE